MEQSDRDVAVRIWPCLRNVFARNCAKGPKPMMAIFSGPLGREVEEEEAMGGERESERG